LFLLLAPPDMLLLYCFLKKKDIPFLLNFQKTNKSVEKMLWKNIENKKQF